MSLLKSRLSRLERVCADGVTTPVWVEIGETEEQALSRLFGNAPRPARLLFVRWANDVSESGPDPSRTVEAA